MKCKKCEKEFKARIIIDGKQKNLSNRKYCLECSPFGKHNTKKIEIENNTDEIIICKICKKPFIYSRKNRDNLKDKTCGSCRVIIHRRKKKKELVKYKGGSCEMCGYNKSVISLQFHHSQPEEKEFEISSSSLSLEKCKKEVDKCILVCANCHGEIHEKDYNIDSYLHHLELAIL